MDLSQMDDKQRRNYFEKIEKDHKNTKKKGQCMYPCCNAQSIGAHTVSKKYYLEQIAESGNVLGPVSRRKNNNKDLVFQEVGVNKASVFYGFCKKHDEIFQSIDKTGIRTKEDLFLQCYRSVCFWKFELKAGNNMIDSIQESAVDSAKSVIVQLIPNENFNCIIKEIMDEKRDNSYLLRELKLALEECFDKGGSDLLQNNQFICYKNIEIFFCRVYEYIPVVLNTMNTITQGYIFHIVLPNENYTDIIVINATNKKLCLSNAWEERTSNMLNILGLIESWMMSCENWFIKPGIIEHIEEDRLKIIEQDIRYWQAEKELWHPYDISIFDELRRKYISFYKERQLLPKAREMYENSKFSSKQRLVKEEREEKMQVKMIDDMFKYIF